MELLLPEHLLEIAWHTTCMEDVRAMAHTCRAWWGALAKTRPRHLWNGLRERHFPIPVPPNPAPLYYACVLALAYDMAGVLMRVSGTYDQWDHNKFTLSDPLSDVMIRDDFDPFMPDFTERKFPKPWRRWRRWPECPPGTAVELCLQFIRHVPHGMLRAVAYTDKQRFGSQTYVRQWAYPGVPVDVHTRTARDWPSSDHDSDKSSESEESSFSSEDDAPPAPRQERPASPPPGAPYPTRPYWIPRRAGE